MAHLSRSWTDQAACRDQPTAVFFPARGVSARHAKAICATCPVTDECLAYARAESITWGIWGGLSPRERQRLGRIAPRRHGPLGPRNIERPPHRRPDLPPSVGQYQAGCRCAECTAHATAYRYRQRLRTATTTTAEN